MSDVQWEYKGTVHTFEGMSDTEAEDLAVKLERQRDQGLPFGEVVVNHCAGDDESLLFRDTCERCRKRVLFEHGLWWSADDDCLCPGGVEFHEVRQ